VLTCVGRGRPVTAWLNIRHTDMPSIEPRSIPKPMMRRVKGAGVARPVVSGEHAPNDVLVDLDAEGSSDLLGDAHAAKVRIATLQRDDGGDEFRARALWAGFAARRRRGRRRGEGASRG